MFQSRKQPINIHTKLIEVENMMEGLRYISLSLLAAFTIMIMKEQKKLHHFTCIVTMELLAKKCDEQLELASLVVAAAHMEE